MECLKNRKQDIRTFFKRQRAEMSSERRKSASLQAQDKLMRIFNSHTQILSFVGFKQEIDTTLVNHLLAKEGKLLLPRAVGEELHIHRVMDPSSQLEANSWGVFEPIPELCPRVGVEYISLVLVPGIAFDPDFHRIGYGKGYYDRFLRHIPDSMKVIGLGYKEQLSQELFPVEPHDIALDQVCLF